MFIYAWSSEQKQNILASDNMLSEPSRVFNGLHVHGRGVNNNLSTTKVPEDVIVGPTTEVKFAYEKVPLVVVPPPFLQLILSLTPVTFI